MHIYVYKYGKITAKINYGIAEDSADRVPPSAPRRKVLRRGAVVYKGHFCC